MSDNAEEVSADLELLDSLERKFLDLDRALDGGRVDRDAVHSLFRNAHSLKGALGLRGAEGASHVVHGIESSLDAMRSGRLEPTRELVDAFLAAADRLRSCLDGADLGAEERERLVAAIERESRSAENKAARRRPACLAEALGFELEPAEADAAIGASASGSRLYLVEKLLDGRLEPAEVEALPIFETLHGIGRIVALRPAAEGVPRNRESVLRILFSSCLPPSELSFVVFDPTREIEVPPAPGSSSGPRRRIGEILVGMGAVDEEAVSAALELRERPLGEVLVEAGRVAPQAVERALEMQGAAGTGGEARRRDVRVDTAKLDKLFDLVGELVTAEATLAASPDIAGLRLPHFTKAFGSLSKITRDLQETAMAVRMIPLEGLFDRMGRLVRDLSRKVGKRVEFVVTGGETEMDKNAIEELADPLAHLIRNAMDHGIESPEARRAAGKGDRGLVRLDATCEGSDIIVSISDDGAGLDRDAILGKAVERGLLSPEAASGAGLSDDAICDLIFLPGFSTSARVSDVSGRGVGLDVVKRNVERLRGVVELAWKPGEGTTFTLRVPLTLAIIDAITLRAGGCCYAIPASDIREFFRPERGSVLRSGLDAIALRDEHLPLVSLEGSPGGEIAPGGEENKVAVVVARGAARACLLVDEVLGAQQVVVKPLPSRLGKAGGFSGCSVNGDGGVSFIVDVGRLIAARDE